MTTVSDRLYQLGGVPVGLDTPGVGNAFFVKPSSGNDVNSGKKPDQALKTLSKALSLATANNGDVVYLIAESNSASSTTDYQSTALDWNKDGVHLIGIGANPFIGQRARISNLSTATAIVDGLFIVSADNCVIKNIAIFQGQGGTNPTGASIAMKVSGERNHIINCQISGIGHSELDDATSRSLTVSGDENTFTNCFIGLDTVIRSTATSEVDVSNGRNIFDNCMIHSYTDNTSFKALTTISSTAGRFVMLRDSILSVITNITSADTPTGAIAHAQAGTVYMVHSGVMGYDDVATADNTNIYVLETTTGVDSGVASTVDILDA